MNQSTDLRVNPQTARVAVAGHFGEIAQGRVGPDGPVAVVTLPCPALVTAVTYRPALGGVTVPGPETAKAAAAARLALSALGEKAAGWGGEIAIERPVAPGLGAGSSTAETLGALRAVAAGFGVAFAPGREAALCLAAEGAVDPLMHGRNCVFATREGRVLRWLAPLPPLLAVGGFAGPPRPTDPDDTAFPDRGALFEAIAAACEAGDAAALGRAATQSAAANQARRPHRAWDGLSALVGRLAAHGVALAHTGAAATLLLPASADPRPALGALSRVGLTGVRHWHIGASADRRSGPEDLC
ncbi:MAG: propanediol utilization protein [Pseudomonadota bacterium]